MRRAFFAAVLLAAPRAHADDVRVAPKPTGYAFVPPSEFVTDRIREYSAEPAKPTDERTAADVAQAPSPGTESGRTDGGEHDSTLRNIGQGALAVPRALIDIVFAPVRGGLWTYDHYGTRLHQLAWDDTNTYGGYPTLVVDNNYGVTVGGKFIHRNLFGEHERFDARVVFGGEFNEGVSGTARSGDRLGPETWLEAKGEFERRPKDLFFGIGNVGDAVKARYRQQLVRAAATLDTKRSDSFHVRIAGALTDLDFDESKEGPPIDMLYPASMLTGFGGTRNLYAELELRYDTRRVTHSLEQKGVLIDAFSGRVFQREAGNDYWRYGGEAIRFQPIGIGRTVATRLHFESVSGEYNDVAFMQLPDLGGKLLLRGYPVDRFRDRVAIAGSTEYFWDVSAFLLASLFVDAGRVYPAMDELSFNDLRVGYGASLQLVEQRSFLAGVSIASSIDGGVFVNLVLDPIYEPEPRVKRR